MGRLDYNTEGLLLFTDDGDLARDLMHPRSHVPKTYAVKIRGFPAPETLSRLRRGLPLDGRKTLPARVEVAHGGANPWLEVTVVEGRKHQVRRMLQIVGHPVVKLRRIRYAGLKLGDLRPGGLRSLHSDEVARLPDAVRSGGSRGGARTIHTGG